MRYFECNDFVIKYNTKLVLHELFVVVVVVVFVDIIWVYNFFY